jgi:hypothetical protein
MTRPRRYPSDPPTKVDVGARGDIAIYSLKYQTYLERREPDCALFLGNDDLHAALSAGCASPDFWLYAAAVTIGHSLMANTYDASNPVVTAVSGHDQSTDTRSVHVRFTANSGRNKFRASDLGSHVGQSFRGSSRSASSSSRCNRLRFMPDERSTAGALKCPQSAARAPEPRQARGNVARVQKAQARRPV